MKFILNINKTGQICVLYGSSLNGEGTEPETGYLPERKKTVQILAFHKKCKEEESSNGWLWEWILFFGDALRIDHASSD